MLQLKTRPSQIVIFFFFNKRNSLVDEKGQEWEEVGSGKGVLVLNRDRVSV